MHLGFMHNLEFGIGSTLCGLRCSTYVKQSGLQIFVEVLYYFFISYTRIYSNGAFWKSRSTQCLHVPANKLMIDLLNLRPVCIGS